MAKAVASSIGRWRVLDACSTSQLVGSLVAAFVAEQNTAGHSSKLLWPGSRLTGTRSERST
jgi:hypothetical protein